MDKREVRIELDSPDPELWAKKLRLLKRFNYECATREERHAVLKELLGHCPERISVTPLFYCDFGCNIFIDENFYSNYNLTILDCGRVTIGKNVFIAPNVDIYTAGHPVDKIMRRAGYEYRAPVEIGDDVWIGGRTAINPGVRVGSNVVIGSGSVVTRDIEDGVVAAGNPCRVLRKISDRDKKYYFKDIEYACGLVEGEYKRAEEKN